MMKTLGLILLIGTIEAAVHAPAATWPSFGQNDNNTSANSKERIISPENASRLAVKWEFTTAGDVSATPAVDSKFVYFPDWGGKLHCLDRDTGQVIWSKSISEYTGVADAVCRATPALTPDALVIGTQLDSAQDGARVFAVAKKTGNLLWITKVDDHPASIVTQSAVVGQGRVYVGVSSSEEGFATDPGYPCCSFRGSILALDLEDGHVLWKTFMTSENKGFSGNAVWGSTPVIDAKRNSLYITTGNNYTVPEAVLDCVAAGGTSEQVRACVASVDGSSENYFDAILALDLATGAVKWVNNVDPVRRLDRWLCFRTGHQLSRSRGAGL
jgi:polyvinyl alcohol dehydrogenase (cytochrome)